MKKFTLFLLLLNVSFLFAQKDVSGKVTDGAGAGLPGVNVKEKGTSNGTSSDFDGNYKIKVKDGATLVFSYVGFSNVEKSTANTSTVDVVLAENGGQSLDEVVVVGTRTPPRSNTATALPVDVLSAKDLTSTGQATFDKALQYRIPSFNTVQTPVNDATSLLDPYEIRNMGPSRTLVLINGKRKNMSSLLYVQTSPGRGETGADISAIPQDAIERVEILRDGASAQYGSDAIAGVMNIILKKSTKSGSTTLRTGITGKGDGEMVGVSLNNGSTVGDKGFINYTIDFSKVALANRPGTVSAEGEYNDFVATSNSSRGNYFDTDPTSSHNILNGVDIDALVGTGANQAEKDADIEAQTAALFAAYKGTAEYAEKLAAINAGNAAGRAAINSFLAEKPDAGNINGSPATASAKFEVNGGFDFSPTTQFYYNAAYVNKKVNSFANYRTPYWRTLQSYLYDPAVSAKYPNWGTGGSSDRSYLASLFGNGSAASYKGYVPTFIGDLNDYNATFGYKSKVNDWNTDASITFGGNEQLYTVESSQNRSGLKDGNGANIYRENSQTSFKPGGTSFDHIVGNIDISRILNENVSIAFGSEFRTENFEVIAGDKGSYDGIGADSFAGNRPENSGKWNRYNLGGYLDVNVTVDDFSLNGTVRAENYSDFGNAVVGKGSASYTFEKMVTLRASYSTGFRAPSLHQIYTQKSQYSFVPGQGIQVSGIINNVSPQAHAIGISHLTPEKSTNITVGLGAKLAKNINVTLDYYDIKMTDRIVLGDKISFAGLGNIAYFSNSLNTQTSGIDIVANWSKIELGSGKLGLNLSGNVTLKNEKTSPVVNNSFSPTLEALAFTSRPDMKWIFGGVYAIDSFELSLNNTYFGKTTFKQDGLDANLHTEFIPKVVTDLGINYNLTDKITFALNANNILDVLPEWKYVAENAAGATSLADPAFVANQTNLLTFNGRYSQMTYDGYHFSQLGRMFSLSMNYKF